MKFGKSKKDKASKVVTLTTRNFDGVVLRDDDVPVLIDYWAPWCGPCRVMGPILDKLAKEFGSSAVIAKLNVDDEPDLADAARIRAIPTMHIIRRGELVEVLTGVQSQADLADYLRSLTRAA